MAYLNPPIAEAVLDIRVRHPQDVSLPTLEAIRDDAYVSLKRPIQFDIKVEMEGSDEPTISHASNSLGFAYSSEDGKRVFQVRRDGFSHNRLAPYQDWLSFQGEAERLWRKYKEAGKPEFIELLGLTYINNITLKPSGRKFDDFFQTYIEVPPELSQEVAAFSFNFQVADAEHDALVRVGQTYGPFSQDGFPTIVMNVQAFKSVHVSADELSEEQIWSLFEHLRHAKNKAFEACITQNTRESFA